MPEDSDYYDSGPAAEPAAQPSSKPGDEKKPESETALLPKSLFPGEPPAIGDVCRFKVEHIWEDEIEVSFQKEGGDEKGVGSKPRSSMDTATDSFDQMAAPAANGE